MIKNINIYQNVHFEKYCDFLLLMSLSSIYSSVINMLGELFWQKRADCSPGISRLGVESLPWHLNQAWPSVIDLSRFQLSPMVISFV